MMDVTAEAERAHASRGHSLRVAFLAQENLAVPPPVPGASVSRVVHELARRLAERHLDVTVASLPHPSVGEGMHEGVRYLRVDNGRDPRVHAAYQQVLRVVRRLDLPHRELQGIPFYAHDYARNGLLRLAEYDPDIVHLQNVSQFVPIARRLLPKSRIVLHMHCDWLRQLPPSTVRQRLREVDLVLGVSDYIAGRVRSGFPELADRVETLHNGVALDMFPPRPADVSAVRRRLGIPDGPVILYVGTFATEKGIHVLLDAFAQVRRQLPSASLVLVGAHNRYFQVCAPRGRAARAALRRQQRGYRSDIERRIEELDGGVILPGARPHHELPDWYAIADVFTMPSTGAEPFPLPVLEAMASVLPVVATANGGLSEAVENRATGLLVAGGDASALAAAVVRLCTDPALARELGERGRARAAEQFSWARQADRLAGLYHELVEAF
jgi:glycosyltransferase involved in cell wall biosynthesis